MSVSQGNLTLEHVTLTENVAQGGSGGGVYVSLGNLTVTNSRVEDNESSRDGGGLSLDIGDLILRDSFIMRNRALTPNSSQGGGVYARNATINNTHFVANFAATNIGGGLYIDNGQLDLRSSTFTHNLIGIGKDGGGLYFIPALLTVNTLVNNVWLGNGAFGANGAAIYIASTQGAEVNVLHNTIADDAWQDGTSGVFCQCATPSDIVNLRNNIIINHGTAVAQAGNGTVTTQANLYFNNTRNEAGVTSSSGHVTANPCFADFTNGDLHLQASSQAIDKGVAVGVTIDLDGAPRPQPQSRRELLALPAAGGEVSQSQN
ncbi:MAG: hypothetical protein HYR94_19575 [Chloroflexi bacterium]|nr:hypothetical protein [Chloroflexota bacterium]